ncbi:MAG: lipid-binding SYLF domain-containing protein [Gemmataceae bacterium]
MRGVFCFATFLAASIVGPATAQPWRTDETQTVESAATVLGEIAHDPLRGIPHRLLADAQAIVIVPDMLKGGFIVGLRHGRGVLLLRDEKGQWRAPAFIAMTGGSFGWQIGIQGSDVVLVFRTRRGVDTLLKGKLTVGADVSVAAGPIGREATAGTDGKLSAEVYSYARTRGLFAGLALDGTAIYPDARADTAYYGPAVAGRPTPIPPSAVKLVAMLSRYTPTPPAAEPLVTDAPTLPKVVEIPKAPEVIAGTKLERSRRDLLEASARLQPLLTDAWKSYLALPAEVYSDKGLPSVDAVGHVLARFATIAKDTRYQTLTMRPEFRATEAALASYFAEIRGRGPVLDLPAPPK